MLTTDIIRTSFCDRWSAEVSPEAPEQEGRQFSFPCFRRRGTLASFQVIGKCSITVGRWIPGPWYGHIRGDIVLPSWPHVVVCLRIGVHGRAYLVCCSRLVPR